MKSLPKLLFSLLLGAAIVPAAQSKEVKILFGLALPPYVIKEADGQASGFEYEIFKAALEARGHTIKPVFVSMGAINKSAAKTLADNQADGAQRGSADLHEGEHYFYAEEPAVVYQAVAVSLQKNQLAINSVADLKGKTINAYQGATNFLGADFAAAVKGNDSYTEVGDEKRRALQLFANGVQVYVGDINVFKYYKASVTGVDASQPVAIHKIFISTDPQFKNPVFRDRQIRDDFNAGLKEIKAKGQYKQLIKKYLKE
ncbi:MAG: transporter substrate-binding domain-containing protein [Pseudomonadota bacterium]